MISYFHSTTLLYYSNIPFSPLKFLSTVLQLICSFFCCFVPDPCAICSTWMHCILCAHSYLLVFTDWRAWTFHLQYCNNCAWRRSYVFSFYDVWAQFMYQSQLRNCCRVNNEILILVVYLSFVRWDYYSTMVFNACLKGNLHICDT